MAITTESFNADGISKIFTLASTILSQSHCRVDFYYDDDGSGTATDHEVPSNVWDVINNSIVFNDAPTDGYVVKITSSTDGEGLDTAPSIYSDIASIINEIVTVSDNTDNINIVSDNTDNINTTADNITNVELIGNDLSNDFEFIVDNGSITEEVTGGSTTSAITTVSNNIANVNTLANDLNSVDSKITIVATDIANVNTVSNNTANINIVSSNSTNINTVATDIVNVNTTADNIANVNTVSSNINDVNNVSTNIEAVKDVASEVFFTDGDESDDFGDVTGFAIESERYIDLAKTRFTTPLDCGDLT